MLGGVLALFSAAAFGLNNASLRRGVLTGSVIQALSITVPLGVPLFIIAITLSGGSINFLALPGPSIMWLSLAGVVHFVFGRYCNYRSTKAIGGNLSGAWRQSNMILALVLAVIILDETFTPLKVLGITLILVGALLTSAQKVKPSNKKDSKKSSSDKVAAFEPNYAEGYLFALLSALAYGSSPILIRTALENMSPQMSVVGGLISYSSAALVVCLFWFLPGQWQHVREMNRTSVKWFSLAAVLVSISQMFRYIALSMAPVSVVAPIQSTSTVFRLIFGWIINREHEIFGGLVILGAVLSMLGVLALTVSLDFVQASVPLPDFIIDMLSFHWP